MKEKTETFYFSDLLVLERRSMKKIPVALGITDVESSAHDYS